MSSGGDQHNGGGSNVYRALRRLPPFYTIQPNALSQAKQLQAWAAFLIDAAAAAFKESGALGISVTPHSPLFRGPREVGRGLSAAGARFVLRHVMEKHGGYLCLPLALESQAGLEEEAERLAAENAAAAAARKNDNADDGFEDITESPGVAAAGSGGAASGSLFLNCDALLILALPCEKIVGTIQKWHDEDQTSHIFSVSEVAEDRDLVKRFKAVMEREGVAAVDIGEPVSLLARGGHQQQPQQQQQAGSLVLTPLDNTTIIDALMTTEHPALAHLKRPTLISSANGSLGLKFD